MNNLDENYYKAQLIDEKIKFIEKYKLKLSDNLCWYSDKNNTIKRIYYKHHYLKTNDMLAILLRKYQLCFGKLKYFRTHINEYEFYKYHTFEGFIKTQLWDTEFFLHIKSQKFIDLRFLQNITQIDVFNNLIIDLNKETNTSN